MPILPLSHTEPFAAVLGVMLHPREEDQAKAEAFACPSMMRKNSRISTAPNTRQAPCNGPDQSIPRASRNVDQNSTARSATSLNETFRPPGRPISRRDVSKPSLQKSSLEKSPIWTRASPEGQGLNDLSTAALVLASRSAAADTWRGLAVAPEFRCSPYISRDYSYPQSVEAEIVAELGGIYSPYTLEHFANTRETDIEHIVARSEAHDSGLCATDPGTRRRFASDLLNLTLAEPSPCGEPRRRGSQTSTGSWAATSRRRRGHACRGGGDAETGSPGRPPRSGASFALGNWRGLPVRSVAGKASCRGRLERLGDRAT